MYLLRAKKSKKLIAVMFLVLILYSLYAFNRVNHNIPETILIYSLIITYAFTIIYYRDKLSIIINISGLKESILRREKEILELNIKERNIEVREMEAEKINQLYRLAEFGRISSGIFHDLINPLTAISLNLEQISCQEDLSLERTRACLNEALIASSKMEDLIGSLKKSIKKESDENIFILHEEIKNTLKLLNYQARKAGVDIRLVGDRSVFYYGDSLKFSQVITNIIVNAIDACKETANKGDQITIKIKKHKQYVLIKISDNGKGIESENMNKIFQPFFTTKKTSGIGLGLSSSKAIIEKDFRGTIKVFSNINQKTVFVIKIPLQP